MTVAPGDAWPPRGIANLVTAGPPAGTRRARIAALRGRPALVGPSASFDGDGSSPTVAPGSGTTRKVAAMGSSAVPHALAVSEGAWPPPRARWIKAVASASLPSRVSRVASIIASFLRSSFIRSSLLQLASGPADPPPQRPLDRLGRTERPEHDDRVDRR